MLGMEVSVVSCLHKVWLWLLEWWPYGVYELSNFLLIVFGIWLSFEGFARKVETNKIYKRTLAVICFLLGGVGMYFDAIARHDSDKTSSKLLAEVGSALVKTNDLLDKTEKLVTNTNSVVVNTGALALFANAATSQLTKLQGEVSGFHNEIEAAKEKHDPRMVQDLEAKAQAVQLKADDLSRELLAITKAPLVASELFDWQGERDMQQQTLHNREWEEQIHYEQRHKDENVQEGIRELQKRWQVEYEKEDEEFAAKLKDLVTTADSLRKELLQHLPTEGVFPIDKLEEQRFTQALANPSALDRNDAATYLRVLAERIPPPK
jgi:hypothetical protein